MEFTLKPKSKKTQKPKNSNPAKSAFQIEESSESDSNEIKKTNKDLIKSSLYNQQHTPQIISALSEDPTLICYDLYKSKTEKEKSSKPSSQDPKYHENIKQHADFKKRERLILKEKYEAKLREQEKSEFGETEEYFTQSYIEYMKQNQIFETHLDQLDQISELTSIANKNPDTFLNRLTSEADTPEKRQKISEILEHVPTPQTVPTSDKRTESQLLNARERYLARKADKTK